MTASQNLNIGLDDHGKRVMLPHSAYDDALAILGRRGRGKTTTAASVIEELHRVGRRFCIIDPTGVWHGLRSSADGKAKGLPVIVMGGEHGDVPLEVGSGKVIAAFVADARNPSTVLDLSAFDDDETERFANDFQRHLYKINRHRLHLVYDECQFIAPENPDSNTAFKMKKAAGKVFQLGRAHGLLPILISPRPSSVSKDCLYACGMMIVHGLTAPADQDSLMKWVKNAGTSDQVQAFRESLSKLPVGVAWVWSPDADIFQRVHMRMRETFDSSKTAGGGSRVPKVRATVDLGALKSSIADTIARAEADDPVKLRGLLAASQAEVRALKSAPPKPEPAKAKTITKVKTVTLKAILPGEVKKLKSILVQHAEKMRKLQQEAKALYEQTSSDVDFLVKCLDTADASYAQVLTALRAQDKPAPVLASTPPALKAQAHVVKNPAPQTGPAGDGAADTGPLGKGERLVLTAIAQNGDKGADLAEISVLTGYKETSRRTYLQRLGSRGLVTMSGDVVVATAAGIASLGDFEPLPTGDDLRRYWLNRLGGGEKQLLQLLVDAHPRAMNKEGLGEAANYKETSVRTYLQRLSARKLIQVQGDSVSVSKDLYS